MQKKLLVLKVMNSGLRTKDLESGESLSLKAQGSFKHSELETITFEVEKEWTFKKQKYATGKIIDRKFLLSNIDVPALEYHRSTRDGACKKPIDHQAIAHFYRQSLGIAVSEEM